MGLDIRWPIGLMFSLIGAMMVVYGIFTSSNAEMYKHSLGININLIWGLLLLIFGVTMLVLAWRGAKEGAGQTGSGEPSVGSPRS
jgi:hypothetical protein